MRPLALDISRLLWRALRPAPGGIDRLELGMARLLLAEEPNTRFVFTDGGVIRPLKPMTARRLIEGAAARWEGHAQDAGCRRVAAYLAGDDAAFPPARTRRTDRHLPLVDGARTLAAELLYRRGGLQPPLAEGLRGAAYLNLSHRNLDDPRLFAALGGCTHRLCYLPDDIPLRSPHFAAPGGAERLTRILRNLAEHPARVVTCSNAARADLQDSAARLGLRLPRIEVVPPPVAALFGESRDRQDGARRFFLMPGLFTGRKNISLIARACRLITDGARFDMLLVGAPGLDAAAVFAGLGDMPSGMRFLRAEGLSDRAMRQLTQAAIAVLAPSLEEGFDYPLHEALACGTPVIASDIPVHREFAAHHAELLAVEDAAAWASALMDFAAPGNGRRAAALEAARRFITPPAASLLRNLVELAREP
ncbi:glycosyltransferase [Sediminicoccus sp. KRV36]|uniref:glycosyltransferase n=1 Tax=Sediminicoccus sp. KRV36 TaxID=3133721 RepID=UPI00200E220D|nr:glycosyltransferase [Sediminicoccus rosea]UPY37124.1 glycosyltransferase [Sediminicoccus rosea]